MRFGDFILFCYSLINSKAKYFEEIMGAYRRDNTNSLTNKTKMLGISLKTDYIEFLNWLRNSAKGSDVHPKDDRIIMKLRKLGRKLLFIKIPVLVKPILVS